MKALLLIADSSLLVSASSLLSCVLEWGRERSMSFNPAYALPPLFVFLKLAHPNVFY